MFGLGMQELIIILVIILVLVGATRVPQLMRGIGLGIREFKSAVKDEDSAPDQAKDKGSKA